MLGHFSSRPRLLLWHQFVRHKTKLNTLKSKHDEQNNQDLLKRLQNLSLIGGKEALDPPKASDVIKEASTSLPPRTLAFEKLSKLIKFYQSDPLTWNASVLGRIFKVPEYYCQNICIFVRPMTYFSTSEYDTVQQIVSTSYVVDVGRMKSDESYLVNYKKIVFPKRYEKLPARAYELPSLSD